MNVSDINSYSNSILKAIVVNSDYNDDPENNFRVQIYIPSIHYDYMNIYQDYMLSDNKSTTGNMDKFPWAVSLVDGLENGDTVYVSNVDNKADSYIVLGAQSNMETNYGKTSVAMGGGSTINCTVSSLVDLCMPIIIHNEVGTAIGDWPDNISLERYTKITPSDGGKGWSIGLIQWHHTRAYDLLLFITTQDENWRNYWTDKSLDLYKDLDSGNQNARLKYQETFQPTPGSALYNGIQGMLGSPKGQIAQRMYASTDIATSVSIMQNSTYDIQNAAIIIYLADIMNQYGNNLPSTLSNASRISKTGKTYMNQLDDFVSYCKSNLGNFNTYRTRRETTYQYITNLNLESSIASVALIGNDSSTDSMADLVTTGNSSLAYIGGNGQYAAPLRGSWQITCSYGVNTRGTKKYVAGAAHNTEATKHTGVDFGCPGGTPVYAADNGVIVASDTSGFGVNVKMQASDGMYILYAHLSKKIVSVGQSVTKGQCVGYSGDTGSAGAYHLHFEVRRYAYFQRGVSDVNPLPFIGLQGDPDSYYDKRVNFQ